VKLLSNSETLDKYLAGKRKQPTLRFSGRRARLAKRNPNTTGTDAHSGSESVPRSAPHSHLCNGQLVGFSVRQFGKSSAYTACFNSPDGRRLKRETHQTRLPAAIDAARAMIEEEYNPKPQAVAPEKATWDVAIDRLTKRLGTSGNRTTTMGYYLKCIRLVRGYSTGPDDITPSKAAAWRDEIMSKPGRRKKRPSAHYVAGIIKGASALWQKWLIDDLKLVTANPWEDVQPPKADKLPVKYATDEMIEQFYAWIAERFGDWPFPKLFLSTKAYTGCRLMDLCSLASPQLRDGRLVFPADLTKGRKERAVPLDDELFDALDGFKGPTWLWEGYIPGLKAALQEKGLPSHRTLDAFAPQRLYFWIESLFADYRKAFPDRTVLTTHMFRKRAFTLAWQKGVDARRASIAYGCNVDTLMRHYVSMDEQQVTDDVFELMTGKKKAKKKSEG
jgi:integrase